MKSKFCREPYTQVLSMEPLKNRKGKKPQKSNNVEKRPLPFNVYANSDDEFWKLWGKNMGTVFLEHRFLRGVEMNWYFGQVYLVLAMDGCSLRWMIINREGTALEPGKQHYLRRVAVGMVDGPHWKDIDQGPSETDMVNKGQGEMEMQEDLGWIRHLAALTKLLSKKKKTYEVEGLQFVDVSINGKESVALVDT
ncbi:unnamed protein product [Lactuca saligna]|uniref:Uncharacterized protein n=1 Tax=Lactuca saligna TaxID=75948 RepID=A0AA35VYS3_LACSI|nr:unnamed protein product [Lactuca saligna]